MYGIIGVKTFSEMSFQCGVTLPQKLNLYVAKIGGANLFFCRSVYRLILSPTGS